MAQAVGVSLRSVQRVWTAHGLAPHRVRTFKLSKDKHFVEKFADVVGLYIDPPAHAIVLSVDEEIANPGSRLHAAGVADEERPRRERGRQALESLH